MVLCVIVGSVIRKAKLLATGEAAAELGVARATLARWWADGLVTPALVTAGGHARWDMAALREQLKHVRRDQD